MRAVSVLLVGIPVATYSLYSLNNNSKNNHNIPGLINVKASEQSLQLQQVQVLFRHGARTPIKSKEDYGNFLNLDSVVWDKERFMKVLPHTSINYLIKSIDGDDFVKPVSHLGLYLTGGCIGGDLTTIGQQEAYDFGNWLFSEYITKHLLISPTYRSNDIYVRSTISKRAVLTAVGVMAGLYKKENLAESVIIHAAPTSSENMCPNFQGCAKLHERFVHYWKEIREGQEAINNTMGLKEGTRPFNFVEILDVIHQRHHHGLFVPEYLFQKEEEIEKHAMEVMLDILGNRNIDQLKNSIGSFVENICCRINEAITGRCKYKMILYSSHDTAVISFLICLGIFDGCWPGFVANVILELYEGKNGKRFIRVLHNRKSVILDKESGEEFLPVEKFMKLVEKYRVVNWDEDCGNDVERIK